MKIKTYRMSGAGNLFTVLDNRNYNFDVNIGSKLAIALCNINSFNDYKSEGLMLINHSDIRDFSVLFYNPDGSSGMMCGNGGRCAVNFAAAFGFIDKVDNINFYMAGNSYKAAIDNDRIKLELPAPLEVRKNIKIDLKDIEIIGTYINVGSDHFVVNIDDINIETNIVDFDLIKFGKAIRYHEIFKPSGTNFNIYKVQNGVIKMRTYERGVEGETGACGTGAISTALTAYLNNEIKLPVELLPTSGEKLTVEIIFSDNQVEKFIMKGPAKITEEKIIDLPKNIIEEKHE